jgi:hypothetical protein
MFAQTAAKLGTCKLQCHHNTHDDAINPLPRSSKSNEKHGCQLAAGDSPVIELGDD